MIIPGLDTSRIEELVAKRIAEDDAHRKRDWFWVEDLERLFGVPREFSDEARRLPKSNPFHLPWRKRHDRAGKRTKVFIHRDDFFPWRDRFFPLATEVDAAEASPTSTRKGG